MPDNTYQENILLKPELYVFDEYQTYDLVLWSNVSKALGALPFLEVNFNYFTSFTVSCLLIDRFTPWDYPWCENYSTLLFEFLYEFSGTDYYDNNSITSKSQNRSVNFGSEVINESLFNDRYGFNLEQIKAEEDTGKSYITIKLPKTDKVEKVVFTWLEYDLDHFDQINNVQVFVKKYRLEYTSIYAPIEINIYIDRIIKFSLVVSSSNNSVAESVNSFFVSNAKLLLYIYFDEFLVLLATEIDNAFPRLFLLLKSVSYTYDLSIDYRQHEHPHKHYSANLNWTSYSYIIRPEYFKLAKIVYANNNYWNNGITKEDKGSPVFFKANLAAYFLNLPVGQDILKNKYPTEVVYVDTGGFSGYFATCYILHTEASEQKYRPNDFGQINYNYLARYPLYFPFPHAGYFNIRQYTNSHFYRSLWRVPANSVGGSGILKKVTGIKCLLFGVVSSFERYEPENAPINQRQNVYYHHKINRIVEILDSGDKLVSGEGFTFIGESISPNEFIFNDNKTVSGVLDYDYFSQAELLSAINPGSGA